MSVSAQQQPAQQAPAGLVPSAGAARLPETLLLLTRDPSLIEALTGVVPEGSLVRVEDEAALAGQMLSGQAGVVFIDAGEGEDPAGRTAALAQRLHAQLPDVVLVAAGDGAAQAVLAPLITDGTIYRFVHKPVSAQRLKLFVEAAWRKREGTSSGTTGQFTALSMSQTQPLLPMSRPVPWFGITSAAATLGVALLWYALRPTPAPPLPRPAPAPATQAPPAPQAAAAPAPPAPAAIAQVRVTPPHHSLPPHPATLRVSAPTLPVPVLPPSPAPVVVSRLSPVVAASAATITEVRAAQERGGAPTSTPPVSEARDPLSVAAVILEREYAVDPEFPEIARDEDLTGYVDLEFLVHADGTVSDVTVLKAQPLGVFEKNAVAAVRQWRYRPIERDGVPVEEHARLRLNFGYK